MPVTEHGTDNRAVNLKDHTVNESTLEVDSERNCHWSQKTIPLPWPKNASQQKIEHRGSKKKGGVGGEEKEEEMMEEEEEERQKGGPWGQTLSRDAPAFLLVPPVWTNSLVLRRHQTQTQSSRASSW